ENFTRAKAIVICKQRFNFPGFQDKPLDAPVPSTWKLENGEWFWYVDQAGGHETPFGRVKPSKDGTPAQALPSLESAAKLETQGNASAKAIEARVYVDPIGLVIPIATAIQ